MKSEIERINAQTVTKEEINALSKTVKKHFEDNPEGTREPKGTRGRPAKSAPSGAGARYTDPNDTGAASSSSQAQPTGAASSSQMQMDTTKKRVIGYRKTNNRF